MHYQIRNNIRVWKSKYSSMIKIYLLFCNFSKKISSSKRFNGYYLNQYSSVNKWYAIASLHNFLRTASHPRDFSYLLRNRVTICCVSCFVIEKNPARGAESYRLILAFPSRSGALNKSGLSRGSIVFLCSYARPSVSFPFSFFYAQNHGNKERRFLDREGRKRHRR